MGAMINPGMKASASDEWTTPQWLFEILDNQFYFDLDVCATDANALCDRWFTKSDDGLAQSWKDKTCFMNPPYGRTIGGWVQKAAHEAKDSSTVVVAVLPARPDTGWWHDFVARYATEVWFLRGRIRFGGYKWNAPFPTAIVVWRGFQMRGEGPEVHHVDWRDKG